MNPFKKYSNTKLIAMTKEFKAYDIAENSELRELAKQIHGRDNAMNIILLQGPLMEELAERLQEQMNSK
jgi:vacuolar-type H+-ATPase subunit F/Vma7